MKNFIYTSGITGISLSILGITLKTLHWPGAGITLLLGLMCLAFIFIPASLVKLQKSTDDGLLKTVYWSAAISFFIMIIGMLLKIQHWPGASWFLITGMLIPFILLLPIYLIYHQKRKLKSDQHFFGIILFFLFLGVFSSLLALNVSKNILDMFNELSMEQNRINKFLLESKNRNNKEIDEALSYIKIMKEDAIKESQGKLSHKNYIVFQNNSNDRVPAKDFYKSLEKIKKLNLNSEQVVKEIESLIQVKNDFKYLSVHHSLFMNIMNNWETQLLILQQNMK